MEYIFFLKILLGMIVITAGSGLMIHSFMHLARMLGYKEYVIGFLIIAFASSFPEHIIAINAVIYGLPEIAYANAIATSIVLLSLVAGMVAIFKRSLATTNFFTSHDFGHMSLSVVLLMFLSADQLISKTDGLLLLLAFLYYAWNLYSHKDHFKIKFRESAKKALPHLIVFLLSFFAIFITADFTVYSIKNFAQSSHISLFIIVATVMAPIGAIPELIYEFNLIRKKESTLIFGDLFSSIVINTTLIIGFVAWLKPITLGPANLVNFSSLFLILLLLVFNLLVRSKNKLTALEGIFLLFTYIIYLSSLFAISLS